MSNPKRPLGPSITTASNGNAATAQLPLGGAVSGLTSDIMGKKVNQQVQIEQANAAGMGGLLGNASNTILSTVNTPGKVLFPGYLSYIKFCADVNEEDKLNIHWTQDGDAYDAAYYKLNARWWPNSEQEPTKASEDQEAREVTLFVAREYIEEKYEPIWPKEHVLNRFASGSNTSSKILKVQILKDSPFRFGQSRDKTRRFIVYHPLSRAPSQGRFVENAIVRVATQISNFVPSVECFGLGLETNESMKSGIDAFKVWFGHPLKEFEYTAVDSTINAGKKLAP